MNATLKAQQLLHKYEAEGWSCGITYQVRAGAYRIVYGKKSNGSTMRNVVTYVHMFRNGKVRHTLSIADEPIFGGEHSIEEDWPVNGRYSRTIEQYLSSVLHAYAAARRGSRAAQDFMLDSGRLVEA